MKHNFVCLCAEQPWGSLLWGIVEAVGSNKCLRFFVFVVHGTDARQWQYFRLTKRSRSAKLWPKHFRSLPQTYQIYESYLSLIYVHHIPTYLLICRYLYYFSMICILNFSLVYCPSWGISLQVIILPIQWFCVPYLSFN